METHTSVIELARDGTVKFPRDIREQFRDLHQLSIIRIGTSLVLAPVPEKWTPNLGRVIHYQNGLVVRDPEIMFGTPVIAGTRIPVRTIVGYIDSGYTSEQVIEEFPHLTREQINAALQFQRERRRRKMRS